MKKVLTLTLALLCMACVWADNNVDVIIKTNAEKIEAFIQEVSNKEVRYKKANNPEGPTFVIELDEIATILYSNGDVQVLEHKAQSEQTNDNNVSESSVLIKKYDDFYYLGDRRMSEDEYLAFIQTNCQEAWDSYQKGRKLWKTGWGLLGAGAAVLSVGMACVIYGSIQLPQAKPEGSPWYKEAYGSLVSGAVLTPIGAGLCLGSIPCLVVGGLKKNRSHNVYNEVCASRQVVATIKLQSSSNGLGLALNF